ncbi:MAG: flippase [Clostridiales bacterium]|nr:flippase [Clostridiales bacterium]
MENNNAIKPKSIKVNYIFNLVYEVFALLTPLITTPYISRVLGAEGVGVYSYTNSIAQYFILFGNLGVATYGQMQIAGCREDRKQTSRVFYELWILRALTMALSLGIYILIAFLTTEYREERLILGILLFASIFDMTWLFRGIEDFSKVVIRNFIVKIVMIAAIFSFVKTKDDVDVYILLVALSTLLGNLTFLFSMRNVLCRVELKSLRIFRHTKQCLIFFIPTIATSVYTLLDKTMLGILTEGTSQNGYYEQAHKIEQILLVAITSLNTIMRSRMSYLYQQGKLDEMRKRLNRSISFIMLISIPIAAGLIGIASNFIPLFLGNGFEESVVLLQIFSLLLIVIGLSNCLNTHFLGPSGRQGKNNYVLAAGAVINFVFNYFTIPVYGAVGAACASVLAETLILIGYLFLIRDFFKFKTMLKLGWRYITAGIVMGFMVYYIGEILNKPLIGLFLQVVLGVVSYGLIIIALRDPFMAEIKKQFFCKVKTKVGKR